MADVQDKKKINLAERVVANEGIREIYNTVGDVVYGLRYWPEDENLRKIIPDLLKALSIKDPSKFKGFLNVDIGKESDRLILIRALEIGGVAEIKIEELAELLMEEATPITESKVTDPYLMEDLLDDLDEYEAMRNKEGEVERLMKTYGRWIERQEVEGVVNQKITLLKTTEAEVASAKPELDREQVGIVAKKVSDAKAEAKMVLERTKLTETERIEVVSKIGRMVMTAEKPEEAGEMLKATLKEKGVREERTVERIVRIVDQNTAERKIELIADKIGKIVAARVQIEEEDEEKLNEVRKIVRERTKEIWTDSRVQLEDGEIGEKIVQIAEKTSEQGKTTVVIALKEAGEEIRATEENNWDLVERYRVGREITEARKEIKKLNPEMKEEQAVVTEEYFEAYRQWSIKTPPMTKIDATEVEAEAKASDPSVKLTRTQVEQGLPRVEVLGRVIHTPPKVFNQLVAVRNKLEKLGVKMPEMFKKPRFDTWNKINELAGQNRTLRNILNLTQRQQVFFNKISKWTASGVGVKVLLKIGAPKAIGKVLGQIGIKTIAGKAVTKFATQTLLAMSKYGVTKGLGIAIKVVATKLGGTAVGSALAAALGAAGFVAPPAWVVAVVVFLIGVAIDVGLWALKKIKGVIDKIRESVGMDMPGTKKFFQEAFGKFFGGILNFGFEVGTLVVGIPIMLVTGASFAAVGPILIIVLIAVFGSNILHIQTIIPGLVPPQTGGGCIKASNMGSGQINCQQGLPPQKVDGVERENFFRVADQWKNGKNYSRECFDAVVCKARSAGVNPAWTLWAWLHESGASNYSSGEVEDFGIHGVAGVPTNDFNAQIGRFLQQDFAARCPSGDYWLMVASQYLNGSCNPDEKHPTTGMTGRDYLNEIKTSWGWISSRALPSTIRSDVGSGECGGGTGTGPDSYEVIDSNGEVWICTGGQYEGGFDTVAPDWDPNAVPPEGCPKGLPVSGGYYTQGPFAPNCSHEYMVSPAVDIGVGDGTEIRATHPGIVGLGHDDIYGFYVDLKGTCEGQEFTTRYSHMPSWLSGLQNNQRVEAGTPIGRVDNTGSSTGTHLHYHITGLAREKFGNYLGISDKATLDKLWGCCGLEWNGKECP